MIITDLILGTAGHIDHGKTSLIRALTGVDTDRLPEEKRRGITIELGFAELVVGDYRLGIVDVPGHERFIRNMLCGATGMDLVMLVVAADNSVKQQTREHLDILRLLDLRAGVIVLTKVDLVDDGWLDLVEAEVRELVKGTFLERAPIVRTSVVTATGLDDLRRELEAAARQVVDERCPEQPLGPFRLAIDRSFSIAGHGTVVTGSVNAGQCSVGDELALEPGSVAVRVRGIHNHDRAVESVRRGQRGAINLVGVHHDQIARGQQLCSTGHLRASKLLTASFTVLASSPRPLKNRSRVKLHLGTAELVAAVRLLGKESLEPGESGPGQLFLSEGTASVWNQPFVIRFESPAATIGGGRVLDPHAERIRKAEPETLEMVSQLASSDLIERASAALYFAGLRDWQPSDLGTAGVAAFESVADQLRKRGDLREITISPTRKVRLHRRVLAMLYGRIEAVLKKLHGQFPLRTSLDRGLLNTRFSYLVDDIILANALNDMRAAGRIICSERGIALAGHGPKLSTNEQKLLLQLVDRFQSAGLQPPSIRDCQQQAAKNQAAVPQLLSLAVANGDLVEIGPELYLHAAVERQARNQLATQFASRPGLTVSEIREILNTSRKYAIPYCEYLDHVGFTVRQGDLRVLAKH